MAADLTQSFVLKHVEKIALAVAVAVFVGAFAWFIVMREPQGNVRRDVARLVGDIRQKSEAPQLADALSKEEIVSLGIGHRATTVAEFEKELNGLPGTWNAVASMVPGQIGPRTVVVVGPQEDVTPPERILAVEEVQACFGRGVTSDEVPTPLAKLEVKDGALSDVVWAGCVGKFDLTAQLDVFTAGNAPLQPIIISKVELQRRDLKSDGEWADWAAVPPAVSLAVAQELPRFPADPREKRTVGAWYAGLTKAQIAIRRMPFYGLVAVDGEGSTVEILAGAGAGDEALQPDLTPPKEEKPDKKEPAKVTPARAAPKPKTAEPGKSPWELIEPAEKVPEAVEVPDEEVSAEHVYATVWANDATVLPGRTYQYRMRVGVASPVYSLPGVKDEEARWTPEYVGQWSEPTEEVSVPEVVQFYFVGTFGQRINLELHRWIHGQWIIVPSAPSNVGAPVVYVKKRTRIAVPGSKDSTEVDADLSPQVLLVDVIKGFPYQEGGNRPIRTNVLVFSDAQGRLGQRIEWADRKESTIARISRMAADSTPTKASGRTTKPSTTRTPPKKRPPAKTSTRR
ncbi:MAG TPA: hypothetical protein VM431_01820 [Phycisphaerae bacterium]|nr:hypothetical protein [Phycisphaerae bacterium]